MPQNIYFANLTKIGILLIHSHPTIIVVWAVVIVKFDTLREQRSVPLPKWSGTACLIILAACRLKTAGLPEL